MGGVRLHKKEEAGGTGHGASIIPLGLHAVKPVLRPATVQAMLRRLCKLLIGLGVLGAIGYAIARATGLTSSDTGGGTGSRDAPPKPSDAWTGLQPTPPDYDKPATTSTALQPDPDAPKAPATAAPEKAAAVTGVASAPWVEPVEGACPASHPVKGKLTSKIFHLPGMLNYERTVPDRCYLDPAAAEADGLRPAKR